MASKPLARLYARTYLGILLYFIFAFAVAWLTSCTAAAPAHQSASRHKLVTHDSRTRMVEPYQPTPALTIK